MALLLHILKLYFQSRGELAALTEMMIVTIYGGSCMKKFVALSLATLLIISLTACAGAGKADVRVKCPACGYEFEPS